MQICDFEDLIDLLSLFLHVGRERIELLHTKVTADVSDQSSRVCQDLSLVDHDKGHGARWVE
jgi:hypothetical protein